MTLITLPRPFIYPDNEMPDNVENHAWTSTLLDAVGEYTGVVFQIPPEDDGKTIDEISWRFGPTAVAGDLDIRLETVNAATGSPDGLVETASNLVRAMGAGDDDIWADVTLTDAHVVSAGEVLAVLCEIPTASTFTGNSRNYTHINRRLRFPYAVWNTGADSVQSVGGTVQTPSFYIQYSDDSYLKVPSVYPYDNVSQSDFNNADAFAEIGIKFQVPFRCRVSGCYGMFGASAADANFQVHLGNSSYTPQDTSSNRLATSLDIDPYAEITGTQRVVQFTQSVILEKDTDYYLTVEATTANDCRINGQLFRNAASMVLSHWGATGVWVQDNGTIFAETAQKQATICLYIDQIDDGVVANNPNLVNVSSFVWPDARYSLSNSPLAGNYTFDADGEYEGWCIQVPPQEDGKKIEKIGWRTVTVTTGGVVECRVEVPDAGGLSNNTLAGTNSYASFTVDAAEDQTWLEGTLIANYTVTGGEFLIIMIKRPTSSTLVSGIRHFNGPDTGYTGFPYRVFNDGTDQKGTGLAQKICLYVKYTDGSYADYGAAISVVESSTVELFNNADTINECGMIFQIPFACRVIGALMQGGQVATGADWALHLGDSSYLPQDGAGASRLATVSSDGDFADADLSSASKEYRFENTVLITKDTDYYLTLEATSANDIRLAYINVTAAERLNATPWNDNFKWVEDAGGTWTEIATRIPIMALVIDQVDDGTGIAPPPVIITRPRRTM